MHSVAPLPPTKSSSDRLDASSFLLFGLIGLFIAIVVASVFVPRWYVNTKLRPTLSPPGSATQFDLVAALPEVEAYVGSGAQLLLFDARHVRADGTMDLTAAYRPSPEVDYVFTRAVPPPDTAPPLGTTQSSSTWQQRVTVKVSRPGQRFFVNSKQGGLTLSYNYVNKGMEKTVNDPAFTNVPEGTDRQICSLRDLWQQAIQLGVPQDGVATITYNSRDYRFKQHGSVKTYIFGLDCKLIP